MRVPPPGPERPSLGGAGGGVNGVGKTTTIAKLAHQDRHQGLTPILVAADTFRAAAVEQLEIWGERVGAAVVKQKTGADPAAVVFDGLAAAWPGARTRCTWILPDVCIPRST